MKKTHQGSIFKVFDISSQEGIDSVVQEDIVQIEVATGNIVLVECLPKESKNQYNVHVHSEIMDAFYKGKVVEWYNTITSTWEVPTNIMWSANEKYRIKE